MKKALIMTGKLATDQEVFYPLYRLDEAGYKVDIAVKGKETVLGEKGIKIVPTLDVPIHQSGEHQNWSILILPGGAKCMEYMRQEKDVIKYIKDFHEAGGVIGSICHAAQLLISAGLVKDRFISGYYSIKDDINNAGGKYMDLPYVVDNRIISSPHYKHSGPWMAAVLQQAANGK